MVETKKIIPFIFSFLIFIQFASAAQVGMFLDSKYMNACPDTLQENFVKIINNGPFTDTFEITAESPDFIKITFSGCGFDNTVPGVTENQVVLAPGESSKCLFYVKPLWTAPSGSYEITLTVASTSGTFNSQKINFDILNCHSVDLHTDAEQAACLDDVIVIPIKITNTGGLFETFEICSLADGTFDRQVIQLEKGQEDTVYFSTKADKDKITKFEVASRDSYAHDYAETKIVTQDCYAFAANLVAEEKEVCLGNASKLRLNIENMGFREDIYTITPSEPQWVTPIEGSISINASSNRTVEINVLPGSLGNKIVSVNVKSLHENIEKTVTADVAAIECYQAELKLTPEVSNVCPCDNSTFTLTIKNVGIFQDAYLLTASNMPSTEVKLQPGESRNFEISVSAPCEPGVYKIDANLSSKKIDMSSTAALLVNTIENCYGVTLYTEKEKEDIKISNDAVKILSITNRGLKETNYSLAVLGPTWVHLPSESVKLKPNETKELYLYISPTFDAKKGEYPVKIIAFSEKGTKDSLDLTLNIPEEIKKEICVEENVTKPENITEAKEKEKVTPGIAVILAIIVALAIIIILYIRFFGFKEETEEKKQKEEKKKNK